MFESLHASTSSDKKIGGTLNELPFRGLMQDVDFCLLTLDGRFYSLGFLCCSLVRSNFPQRKAQMLQLLRPMSRIEHRWRSYLRRPLSSAETAAPMRCRATSAMWVSALLAEMEGVIFYLAQQYTLQPLNISFRYRKNTRPPETTRCDHHTHSMSHEICVWLLLSLPI